MPQTCRRNRTPAQGSAAWTGSYWTAISPTCLKRSIHFTILPNISMKMTVSPLFRVYRHLFWMHSCLAFSVTVSRFDKMLSLSGRLKSILLLSSSLSSAAARAQRSFLAPSEKLAEPCLKSTCWMDPRALPERQC
jgi:hypothetical protein